MYAEFYRSGGLMIFPLVGLFIFIAAFALALARVAGPRARARFEREALLPLADDAPAARPPGDGANPGETHV